MRPNGWVNPYIEKCPVFSEDFSNPNKGKAYAYEAGADAYEEGLKKEGKRIEPGDELSLMWQKPAKNTGEVSQRGHIYSGDIRGYLVFIPEEE